MDELIPILILGLVLIPTLLSFNKTKTQQQEQQKAQKARQQAPAKPAKAAKPATVLPPREQAPARPTLQPTLHDHSGMFDGSLYADNGTEGTDPHDHGFDHEVEMPSDHSEQIINSSLTGAPAKPAPARGPVLDFSPRNIASAFVLQEVLKRK